MIRFGEWLPDQPQLENKGASFVRDCLPTINGYKPYYSLVPYSDALDAYCRGAISVKDTAGAIYNYAGDAAKLYTLSTDAWSNVSVGGGYSTATGESWEFVKWGNKVLAVNFSNNPQEITLGGANFSNLTTALRMRHIAVVRNFVVGGNTYDGVDGNVPYRVRWSALNDETDWTVSASTQADYQDLVGNGGWVQAISGGEYGVVFQERSIWRMSYVGSPVIFQFDETIPNMGTPAPKSIVRHGDIIFALLQDGFYIVRNGSELIPIGEGKVDKYFFKDIDFSNIKRMVGTIDRRNQCVRWIYPGQHNENGTPNKELIYNWVSQHWSQAYSEAEFIYNAAGSSATLEGLDAISSSIDALTESLDAPTYIGGVRELAAFNMQHMLGFFSGDALTATVETAEAQLTKGKKTFIGRVRPIVDVADTVKVALGYRNRQQDVINWLGSKPTNGDGVCAFRNQARFHIARVTVESADFGEMLGVDVDAAPGVNR